ncbi:MAG TPA: adenylate/guanylate cyclase domain-containing protein [Clostridia bacterium]
MKPNNIIKLKIIGSVILILIMGYMSFSHLYYYLSGENPLSRKVGFKDVYSAVVDSDRNIYRIDQSKKRITKASSDGIVQFEIDLNQGNNRDNMWFTRVEAGEGDSIYVTRTTRYRDNQCLEEIIQYSANTPFPKERVLYTKQKSKPSEDIIELKYYDNYLYFIQAEDSEKGKKISVKKILKDASCQTIVPDLILPNEYCLNKITYNYSEEESHNFYFTSKKGEIYTFSYPSLDFTKVYQDNKSNPVFIQLSSDGKKIIFADEMDRSIRSLDLGIFQKEGLIGIGKTKELLSGMKFKELADDQHVSLITESMHLSSDKKNNEDITCSISDRVVSASENKVTGRIEARYKASYSFIKIIYWFFPAGTFVLLVYILFLSYKYIRRKIIRKQILLYISIISMTFILISSILVTQIQSILISEAGRQLEAKINIGVSQLNTDDLESINRTADYNGEAFNRLKKYIMTIQNDDLDKMTVSNKDIIRGANNLQADNDNGLFTSMKKLITGFLKPTISQNEYITNLYKVDMTDKENYVFNFCVMSDDRRSPFHPYFIPDINDKRSYEYAVDKDKIVFFENQKDANGEYIECLKRIKLKNHNGFGLYELEINKAYISKCIREFTLKLIIVILIVLILCIILIYLVTRRLLSPLDVLKEGVEKLDGKTFGDKLSIHTGDELEILSNSFNKMNSTLQEYIADIESTKNAYARFVPRQINKYLYDKGIVDIKLRDQNTIRMCVMISNIRSFYSLSKNMSAQESFDFINEYLKNIGPVIPKYHGFINEFLGCGVMALFPEDGQADNCLDAALKIQENVRKINLELTESRRPNFEICTAVHMCEKLIFGIVGFQSEVEDRLEAAAIDEGVVLVETLENAAAKLGASIIATESVIKNISDSNKYRYRYLGLFVFESVNEPVKIYDVYEADKEELRKLKEMTKEQFDLGVLKYQKMEFREAREIFIDIIGKNSRDEAAKIYFFLCDEYIKRVPRNWSEVINL